MNRVKMVEPVVYVMGLSGSLALWIKSQHAYKYGNKLNPRLSALSHPAENRGKLVVYMNSGSPICLVANIFV